MNTLESRMLNTILITVLLAGSIMPAITQAQRDHYLAEMQKNIQHFHALKAQAQSKRPGRLTLHPGQAQIRREAKRFNVLCLGRRTGKTKLLCDLLIETSEQGYPAGYFAPSYKHLMDGWRDLISMADPILAKAPDKQEHRIELRGGGVIECWSLDGEGAGGKKDYKAGRSRKYKRVVIDEAGLVPELEGIFDYAISPTLIDLKGDVWFGGTPNGRGGFYRYYLKGQKGNDRYHPDWMSWQMPTITNTTIPGLAEEIEREREAKPEEAFRQEYLAEFLADSGQVFRNIHACSVPRAEIWQDSPIPFHVYLIAWDLAKKNDFSVLCVIDCSTKKLVHIDRFNQVAYMNQIPRLIALAEKFQPVEIVVEQNGNEALVEMLHACKYQKRGPAPRIHRNPVYTDISEEDYRAAEEALFKFHEFANSRQFHSANLPITEFVATNTSKEEAIQALVLAFERKEISIPDDMILLEELENFGMERLPSGRMRYAAQGAGHDDIVMSLSEGWYRARRYMSVEALTIREKALRSLPQELRPENIANNPHPMAEVSARYHMNAFENEYRKKQNNHFMNSFKNLGR